LEARSPLLDARLVEFAFATLLRDPSRYGGKRPLRKMAEALLGAEVAEAAKEPFQTPFAAWFAGPLRGYVQESLAVLKSNLAGVFDYTRLAQVEAEHAERRRNHDFKLWGLVTLAEWSKLFPGVRVSEPRETGDATPRAISR
jgi:asparagine synthetase B (glutamine-hydrolysing)